MILQVCETRLYWRGSLMCMPPPTFESPPSLRPTVCSSHDPSRCPFHKYTASACGLASFPRKRESRGRAPWGLDARLRGHDILLAQDLRNGHLDALGLYSTEVYQKTREATIARQQEELLELSTPVVKLWD